MLSAYWAPLTAFSATLVTLWWLLRSRSALTVLDRPNERSLHQHPVPRTGGIGIHAGIGLAWLILAPGMAPVSWICLLILLVVSCADDIRDVPVISRLAVHIVTATAVAYLLLRDLRDPWPILIAALAITWMTNLYNFMDGADGLAGGMTLFGFCFYGIAAWLSGNPEFAMLNFSVSTAAVAFLIFNFYPAKIFMGDAGSIPLGYLAAAFGVFGWINNYWNWWFPVAVFSPFIVDASVTLARRLLHRERVWQAHRDHYYQRLVQLGWGHRNTALAEYALMVGCGAAALVSLRLPQVAVAIIVLLAATYIVLIAMITRAWAKMKVAG